MTNLVICCDGTWNTPDQMEGGVPAPTNVVKLYNALADVDAAGAHQDKYYHPGVGSDGGWWNKLMGGSVGEGLDKNIQSAYHHLCDHYTAGDDIYVFGFSRGAYTARSLVGLITCCGLLDIGGLSDDEKWQRIGQLFQQCYRRKTASHRDAVGWGWKFLADPSLPIRFVGVWDTVGALGIPDDLAFLKLIDSLHDYTFHDTALAPNVRTARHAVALDEMRRAFQPTLWTNIPAEADVKQVWFPGVHCDVGGGYHNAGLSDGALAWMVAEATKAGLNFVRGITNQVRPNFQDVLHNSCDGIFAYLATQPRSAPFIAPSPEVDPSAVDRQAAPPITQAPYRPNRTLPVGATITLDVFSLQPWNASGLYLEAGGIYQFAASGQWMDSSITCGPAGCDDGTFQPAKLGQMFGTALGKAEELFKAVTGNTEADFRFTRRHEGAPWFCLMGAIANGSGVDAKGHLAGHETFAIGDGGIYVPNKSGHFYPFANDAWNCYGNNRGHIKLTVARLAAGAPTLKSLS